jgi:CheY-like chemotaxis protein
MKSVVIIDDNEAVRLVLSSFFSYLYHKKFQTFTAGEGVKGLGYVFIARPDLIIVDLTLPEYSGREVIQFLSSNNFILEHKTPVIVLTEDDKAIKLPDHFICINKGSKDFLENLSARVSEFFKFQPRQSLTTRLFRFIGNRLINRGNSVDVAQESNTSRIQKIFGFPKLLFLNLRFSFFVALFFIFFTRKSVESNLDLKNKDYKSFRTRAYPAIAVTLASLSLVVLQLFAFGGIGLTALLRGFTPVYAAAYTWDGGGTDGTCGGAAGDGNKWSCALNWSADIMPTSIDTVTFNGTSTKNAVVDAGFGGVVTSVSISAGYTGTISLERSLRTSSTFTQSAGTFTASNQTLDVDSTLTLTGGSFTASSGSTILGAGLTSNGTTAFNANGGTVTLDSGAGGSLGCNNITFNLVVVAGTQTKTIESTCTIPLGNNPTISGLTVNGTLSGTGTLTTSSGNPLVLNSLGSLSGFSGFVSTSGSFTIAGSNPNFSAYTTFVAGGSISMSSGSLTLPSGADLNDNLVISGGTFNAPSGTMTLAGSLTISNSPTFNANGGTVTFDGAPGGTMSCNNVTFSLVTFNNSGSKTFNSNCSIPLGNNPVLAGSGTVLINGGTFSGTGSFTKTAGTLSIVGATAQLSGFNQFTANAVSVSSSAVLNLSAYTTAVFNSTLTLSSGTVSVPSDADFNLGIVHSGGTFNAPAGNMTVDGNLTISGAAVFNANGGTVTFNGSNASSTATCNGMSFSNVVIAATGSAIKGFTGCPAIPLGNNPSTTRATFVNSTVSGTGTWTMAGGGDTAFATGAVISGFSGIVAQGFTVSGANLNLSGYTSFVQGPAGNTVVLSSGSLSLPSGADINGNLTISGGAFTAPAGTLNIAGSLTMSGASTFSASGGTVNFDGSGGAGTTSCNNATFNLVTFTFLTGTRTISSNCTLPLGNDPVLATANGSTQIINNGTLTGTGTLNTGVFNFNTGSALSGFTGMNLGSTFTVAGGTANFSGYTSFVATGASGGAPVVLSSGSLSLPSGADLNSTLTISGGTFTAPAGTMSLAGNLTVSGSPTFNANGGTLIIDGAGATLSCNNVTFNLVQFNHASGTKTVNSNCNLPLGNNPPLNGGVTGSIVLNGTLTGTGAMLHSPATSGVTFTLNSGAVLSGFSGFHGRNFTVSGASLNLSSYTTFIIDGAVTLNTGSLTLPDGADLNNGLIINGGTFNAPSGTMTIDAALTITGSPTFNHNNGTISFDGTTDATLTCNSVVFNLVTFTHTGATTKTIGSNCTIPVGNNPTVTGRIRLNATTATLTGSGLFTSTCEQSNCLRLTSGSFTGFSGLIAYGNVSADGGTLNMSSYSPLRIYGRNASQSLSITSGGNVTAPSGLMQLYDRINFGTGSTFNHNNGTVEFLSEASDTTVGVAAGDMTFYNLTSNISIPTSFLAPAGVTITVLNTFALKGMDNSNLLTIDSDTSGSQWFFDVSDASTIDLEYLSVKDNNSLNRIIHTAGLNVTNGGNNTNWNFANPEISDLGPSSLVNGSATSDTTPKFTFTVVDPQSADQVSYQIQVDNNSNFSSPEKNKTSAYAAQGDFSFTPTSGLPDGNYYWRVRGFDNQDGVSPYLVANDGEKAFTVDTTPPTGNIIIRDSGAKNPLTVRLLTPATDALSGVKQMMISESLSFSGETWQDYTTSQDYTFSSGGHNTVYVKYRDGVNNESYAYGASVVIVLPGKEPTKPPPDTGASGNLKLYDILVKIVDLNNQPLTGAKITLSPAAKIATVQSDGSYKFEDAVAGEHDLIIEYAGTRTESKVKLTGDNKEIVIKIVIEAKQQENNFGFDFNIWICGGSLSLLLFALVVFGILLWRRNKEAKKETHHKKKNPYYEKDA